MKIANIEGPMMADMGILERNIFLFKNGYGASMLRFDTGLLEIAVLDKDGAITYDTDVTDDVISTFDEEYLLHTLAKIARIEVS
jgi:hypothetical protein